MGRLQEEEGSDWDPRDKDQDCNGHSNLQHAESGGSDVFDAPGVNVYTGSRNVATARNAISATVIATRGITASAAVADVGQSWQALSFRAWESGDSKPSEFPSGGGTGAKVDGASMHRAHSLPDIIPPHVSRPPGAGSVSRTSSGGALPSLGAVLHEAPLRPSSNGKWRWKQRRRESHGHAVSAVSSGELGGSAAPEKVHANTEKCKGAEEAAQPLASAGGFMRAGRRRSSVPGVLLGRKSRMR